MKLFVLLQVQKIVEKGALSPLLTVFSKSSFQGLLQSVLCCEVLNTQGVNSTKLNLYDQVNEVPGTLFKFIE